MEGISSPDKKPINSNTSFTSRSKQIIVQEKKSL